MITSIGWEWVPHRLRKINTANASVHFEYKRGYVNLAGTGAAFFSGGGFASTPCGTSTLRSVPDISKIENSNLMITRYRARGAQADKSFKPRSSL